MTRRQRHGRPSSPTEIARRRALDQQAALAAERAIDRDPERWGVAVEALTLPANATVEVQTAPAGRVIRARRQDVFDLFLARGKLSAAAFNAVRRLQTDIAILHRSVACAADYSPRVDRTRETDSFTDVRHRASVRVETVLSLTGPVSARLLGALCEADAAVGGAGEWRALVARETGERLADAQGAALRAACENLAEAYRLIDRGRGNGAARLNP